VQVQYKEEAEKKLKTGNARDHKHHDGQTTETGSTVWWWPT